MAKIAGPQGSDYKIHAVTILVFELKIQKKLADLFVLPYFNLLVFVENLNPIILP